MYLKKYMKKKKLNWQTNNESYIINKGIFESISLVLFCVTNNILRYFDNFNKK